MLSLMRDDLPSRDDESPSPPRHAVTPRITGIDLFRGLLVVFVILGHFAELTQRHHFLTWFGWGFRMPLFIGLSGYLFNLEHARSVSSGTLLGKYYDRLILPWLAACAVSLVVTGMLTWVSPISIIVRPPFHLWFVPVILVFIFAAQTCRLSPTAMLAAAIPLSIAAMYTFGVGHGVSQFGQWMPDRRYFIYLIYFALGMWVARQPSGRWKRGPALAVASIGSVWWAWLYLYPFPQAEVAAELFMCIPLIALFPWLRRISFDLPLVTAIGRDSLFFYLWHPLAFAVWSSWGLSGLPLLVLSAASILVAWVAIARLPSLCGIMGVRPAGDLAGIGRDTGADAASTARIV